MYEREFMATIQISLRFTHLYVVHSLIAPPSYKSILLSPQLKCSQRTLECTLHLYITSILSSFSLIVSIHFVSVYYC